MAPGPHTAPKPPIVEDDELLARYLDGAPEAFAELVRRHHGAVGTFVLRMLGRRHKELAADVTQDVFVRMLKGAASYQPGTSFSAWMFTIARNRCLDVLRSSWFQSHVRTRPAYPEEANAQPGGSDPEARLRHDQLKARLDEAVTALTPRQRQIFLLHRAGLDPAGIGEVLGLSDGAVRYHMFEARVRLRQALAEFVNP